MTRLRPNPDRGSGGQAHPRKSAKIVTPRDQRMLDILTAAAEAGDVCPSNDELCGLMGMGSIGAPPQVMNRLVAHGLIALERFAQSRIVTILATGKATAGVRGEPHFSEAESRVTPVHRLDDDEALIFKRELEDYLTSTNSARVRVSLEALGHTSGIQNVLNARNPNRDTAESFRAVMRAHPDGLPARQKSARSTTASGGKKQTPEPTMRAEELDARRGEGERRHQIHEIECLQAHRQKYGNAPFGKMLERMAV